MAVNTSELAEKLDKELDEYISNLKPKKYEEGWPEDKWEEEMGKHPFFMEKPLNESEEVPPLVEALQQLKYDPNENTPEELAKAHKDDGNQYFKVKKYRWAVEAYSEGLKHKNDCDDKVLISQLFVNRAAAHFHIGNYKKSLNDALEAKNLQPGYKKAIRRGALCCFQLKQLEDCISWCQEGLKLEPSNTELIELKVKAEKQLKIMERDKRKAAIKETKEKKEMLKLLEALLKRGIKINDPAEIRPENQSLVDSIVHLDENDCLVWPVMFLYPEYGTTDSIEYFHENACFSDHFNEMFSEGNRPAWDVENKYQPDKLQVYFRCKGHDRVIPVDANQNLKSVISDSRFMLCSGTPSFFITSRESNFDKHWRERNCI